jgi:hypothetical protein
MMGESTTPSGSVVSLGQTGLRGVRQAAADLGVG